MKRKPESDESSEEVEPPRKRKKKEKKAKKEKKDKESKSPKKSKKTKTAELEDDTVSMSPPESPRSVAESSDDGATETEEQREGAFKNFRISPTTVAGMEKRGITHLFPIQAKTFNYVYDSRDILAQARTGSGKTISFALPVVERFRAEGVEQKRGRAPLVLCMAPTRELARQVAEEFRNLSGRDLYTYCIYGGVPYDAQEAAISSGIDILVGTPGRVRDHVERHQAGRGGLDLSNLKVVILDEADRMLEQGFSETVEFLLKAAFAAKGSTDGEKKDCDLQTVLFSATVPSWVEDVAGRYMKKPKRVDLIGSATLKTSETVQHKAIRCRWQERAAVLGDIIQVRIHLELESFCPPPPPPTSH